MFDNNYFSTFLKESANLADRLIKGQVINAQNAESIYILKNENQKLKDKIEELMQQTQIKQTNDLTNEKELLHEKVNMLLEVCILILFIDSNKHIYNFH